MRIRNLNLHFGSKHVLKNIRLDIPANAGLKTSTKRGNKVVVSVSEWVDGNTLAQNMRFDVLWGNEVLDPRRGLRQTS